MQSVLTENVVNVQVRRGNAPVKYALALAFRRSNDNPARGAFVAMAHRLRRELSQTAKPPRDAARRDSPGRKA